MSTTTVNTGGLSASSLWCPKGVSTSGSKLFVADYANNRVLVWNSMPTANNQAADYVIGKANFTTNSLDLTASLIAWPRAVKVQDSKLLISDEYSGRILVWNTIPTTSGQAAGVVIGAPDFTTAALGCSPTTLHNPGQFTFIGSKLVVNDYTNRRVVIWNSIPTSNGTAANIVLGQSDLSTCSMGATSSTSMGRPTGIATDGTKLYVSDWDANRIMIWNSVPTTSNQAADAVFGQPDFTSATSNYGGLSGTSLSGPSVLTYWQNRLYISDTKNYRILSIISP